MQSASQPVISTFKEDFFRQFCYLFFTDIDRIGNGQVYSEYEKREPGYGKAMLSAYRFAFSQKLDRKINKEFILELHKHAVGHLPKAKPGKFKTESNNFVIGLPVVSVGGGEFIPAENPNATIEGFREFIKTWLIDEKNPVHFVHFKSENRHIYLTPGIFRGIRGLWVQMISPGKKVMMPYSEALNEMLESTLSYAGFKCHINATPIDVHRNLGYTDSIEKIVSDRTDILCESYNQAILKTKTDDDKLEVIVRHAQRMTQLHIVDDGNIRTLCALINRLLHEEGMPLCIFINPNRLDCFSVRELTEMVKQGQEYYLHLCRGLKPQFNDKYLLKQPDIQPCVIPGSEQEIDGFVALAKANLANLLKDQPRLYDARVFARVLPLPGSSTPCADHSGLQP